MNKIRIFGLKTVDPAECDIFGESTVVIWHRPNYHISCVVEGENRRWYKSYNDKSLRITEMDALQEVGQ